MHVVVPEGVEWSALSRALRARDTVLAGGQGKLTGRVFRIGHLGAVNVDDIVRAHGGAVGVDTSSLGGARFWFSIPLEPETPLS